MPQGRQQAGQQAGGAEAEGAGGYPVLDGKPAIPAMTLSGAPGVLLQGGVASPNVIVCRGWSCLDSPRR